MSGCVSAFLAVQRSVFRILLCLCAPVLSAFHPASPADRWMVSARLRTALCAWQEGTDPTNRTRFHDSPFPCAAHDVPPFLHSCRPLCPPCLPPCLPGRLTISARHVIPPPPASTARGDTSGSCARRGRERTHHGCPPALSKHERGSLVKAP